MSPSLATVDGTRTHSTCFLLTSGSREKRLTADVGEQAAAAEQEATAVTLDKTEALGKERAPV